MRYDDIRPTDGRLPRGYPVLAHISIDPVKWFEFERLIGDTPTTRIIGRDDPRDERLVVHVACASTSVREPQRESGLSERVRKHMVVGTASTTTKLATNSQFSVTFNKGICEHP